MAILVAAFAGDVLTGEQVSFSLGYMLAIGLAGWLVSRDAALLMAGLCGAAWLVSYQLVGHPFSRPGVLYWNLAVEWGIYFTTALAVARVRAAVEREHALGSQLRNAYSVLDREVEKAGVLQRELLLDKPLDIRGFTTRVLYATSTRAGGDLYDLLPLGDGRVGIMIADASGHGVSAAVLMGITLVLTRTFSEAAAEPIDVLERINRRLCRTLPSGSFVTACYAVLDPADGRLVYALAGHDPPLVHRAATGRIEQLAVRGGPPLGIDLAFPRESGSTVLEPGDTLVSYTDGLTEAMDPASEMFGLGRLVAALEAEASSADERMEAVLRSVREFTAGTEFQDDVTLLLLRRCASPSTASATRVR